MSVFEKTDTDSKRTKLIKPKRLNYLRMLTKKYYSQHRRCPNCNGTKNHKFDYEKWLNIDSLDTYVNGNRCECICGWVGIVHDRLPFEENKNEN